MPYVKRGARGEIQAVSEVPEKGFGEEVDENDADLRAFLRGFEPHALADTDLSFIRVLEDLIDLLISRNVIRFTDLPTAAQRKMLDRRELRDQLRPSLDLLEDGDDPLI